MAAMHEVMVLLLASYAARGRFPRPNDVTQEDINEVQRLGAAVGDDLVRRLRLLGSTPRPDDGLRPLIQQLDKQVDIYENLELLEYARGQIPLDELKKTAEKTQASESPLPGYEDALAEALVKWFKPAYFVWRDPIKCPSCRGATTSKGMTQPTQDDLLGGAGRVELHQCINTSGCGAMVRFPRYNNLKYLMRSKVGRCGEFANLFALFVRAVGLRGRYVWNAEDHVWNEYWSPALNRWVHLDSCENARDQHLLYDVGWGKKQSYILAFCTEGAQDVSRAYIKDFEAALPRRNRTSEFDLEKALEEVTKRRRAGLSAERLRQLEEEDKGQLKFLRGEQDDDTTLPARQSGTAEWKAARGEDGSNKP